ncbi:hypothetical protein TNCV_634681 [Trichonephila clavipes]|nr:hypothetical protein TNCV_634681 [Trichonephila clavipes]
MSDRTDEICVEDSEMELFTGVRGGEGFKRLKDDCLVFKKRSDLSSFSIRVSNPVGNLRNLYLTKLSSATAHEGQGLLCPLGAEMHEQCPDQKGRCTLILGQPNDYGHELVTIVVESWIRVLMPLKPLHEEWLIHVKSVEAQSPHIDVMWMSGRNSDVILLA